MSTSAASLSLALILQVASPWLESHHDDEMLALEVSDVVEGFAALVDAKIYTSAESVTAGEVQAAFRTLARERVGDDEGRALRRRAYGVIAAEMEKAGHVAGGFSKRGLGRVWRMAADHTYKTTGSAGHYALDCFDLGLDAKSARLP